MNFLTDFFDQTPKTTLYRELKVQLFVQNFLTWHFGLKSGQLFNLLFHFLPTGQKDGVDGKTHVIVLIEQQFQCSCFRVNERALQTEDPSQRANDDEPGTFLLTWNIPCIMTATSCVVLAAYDGRCVTSLSVLSSRSNVFKKHVSTFLGQMWRVLFSVNRLNSQLLIMQVKIFFSNFSFSTFDTKWFWKLVYFLWTKKFWG